MVVRVYSPQSVVRSQSGGPDVAMMQFAPKVDCQLADLTLSGCRLRTADYGLI